ncbi:MAG: PQQ-binding-like beta-propeller repeat protein, partial [Bacteroidetes bacterium]|nr:PQQ-binding-like beta-propeller repeat protein [Bacteroidota bacterium]
LVDTSLQTAAFLFEKNFVAVSLSANKVSAQVPVKIDDRFNPLFSTAVGCGVLAEDKIIHFHAEAAKTSHIPMEIEAIRNMTVAPTDSGAVLVVSTDDKVMGWNTVTGKSLWQTPLKFQPANGFIHRFLGNDSGNVIMTYLDPSQDLKLSLMSINAVTGKINYRTLVAHADESLPKRTLPLPALAAVPQAADPSFGYGNAGFEYTVTVADGHAVFLIRTTAEMILPGTEKPGGEGFVRLDIRTGEVLSRNYLTIADGLSFDGGLASLAQPLSIGDLIIIPGNKKVVALDATTGALRWMLIEQDLSNSYVFDIKMVDTVLYLRTGAHKQQYAYDEKREKISVEDLWEEDDYTLIAVDTGKGKVHWTRKFDGDPGHAFLAYSLNRFTKGNTQIFAADESYLYSIALDTSKHRTLGWKFEYSDSGVGSMDLKHLYQRSEYWNGEGDVAAAQRGDVHLVTKTASYVGEGFTTALMKFLQIELDQEADRLYLYGDDGIASVNATTGRVAWLYEWDYNIKAIKHRPVHLKGHLFYAMDGKAVLLNKTNGKVTATTDADKEQGLFIMPDHGSVIIIDGDEVHGMVVPQ